MNANDSNVTRQIQHKEMKHRLLQKKLAYNQLREGADSLLADGYLFWTERLLLLLIRFLSGLRLEQLDDVHPQPTTDTAEKQTKEALLEAAAEAALGGHNLGEWVVVENGWQAACLLCGQTTWIGENGLRYSLLADRCDGREVR